MKPQTARQIIPKIIPVLLLVGCATTCPAPVEVQVPVAVPCVTAAPARPVYEFDRLPATASAGDKVLALARDWVKGRKYEGELEATLAGCLPAPEN